MLIVCLVFGSAVAGDYALAGTGTDTHLLVADGAEHGFCVSSVLQAREVFSGGYFVGNCNEGAAPLVRVSSDAARTGNWGYVFEVTYGEMPSEAFDQALPASRLTASGNVTAVQLPGALMRYEAHFFVASGFDHRDWHILMQWKGQSERYSGVDRFWPGQNPKIALGFMRRDGPERQVEVIVRDAYPGRCDGFAYDRFTRFSTLRQTAIPVPDREWVRVVMEMHLDEADGSIRVWQGEEADSELVIDVEGINTLSQLLNPEHAKAGDVPCTSASGRRYFRSQPTNLNFALANYTSGKSFRDGRESHTLHVDDIRVERVR